jgi:hypothetical protein
MLVMNAPVVPLQRRHRPRETRVIYELARLRVAETREPPPRLLPLLRPRD